MAASSVSTGRAGSGAATTSGHPVSAIHYTIDTDQLGDYENAANIASVSFALDQPASVGGLSAAFVDSHQTQVTRYGACTQTAGFGDRQHFTCRPDATQPEVNLAQVVSLVVNTAP